MSEFFHQAIYFLSQFNWVDVVVVAGAVLYMIEGYGTGFLGGIFDIAGFLLSFALALKFHGDLGTAFSRVFHLSNSIGNVIGFALIAILVELVLRLLQKKLDMYIDRIPGFYESSVGKTNQWLGIIPGFFSGMVLLAFFLTIFVVVPISLPVKQAIGDSAFGSKLVEQTQSLEKNLVGMFGGSTNNLLTFFTIEPQTNSLIKLDFTYPDSTSDTQAEERMLILVNAERAKQNLPPLMGDDKLKQVGELHASDMLARGYFSHYTPEGLSPFDRMAAANISYEYAGENLAFSPNVDLAMQGLMQSPGHRANILSPNYHRVGIGVMNAGIYGEMFAQEFTD
ncbi:MAG: CvpA family protein [Patescibacteria group bacterium]|nr:CvpA family protein [Patescibacteria group bacterium]MDE2589188.1 CvpA family protein [Patescibacteria group bacterium]